MIPVKIIRKTKATAAATAAAAQNIDTDLFLPRTLFDDLFRKVLITPEVIDDDGNVTTHARYAIQANYDLYSIGGISAYRHSDTPAGGTAAGIDIEQILTDGTPVAAINGVTIYAPQATSGASTWAELTGKPAWLTDTQPAVSVFRNDAGYITAAALAGYPTTNQVATLIDNSEQALKDWVNAKNYATQSYVDAAKVTGYGKSLEAAGKSIHLKDESGASLSNVVAPYAAYTERIGTENGDHKGLKTLYWSKNDNSGYPTYLLIAEVCTASEWSSWGTGHGLYGVSGTVHGARTGNMHGTGTWHINAAVCYSTSYILTETSNSEYMQPCVVTYNGKVYVALRLIGSGYDMIFTGNYHDGNILGSPIQVNCTDAQGTCAAVGVLKDYTGVRLTARELDADIFEAKTVLTDEIRTISASALLTVHGNVSLANGSLKAAGNITATYDIMTTNGKLSVAGNATVQGETHLNGSVYLPDAYTFFGTSGIYVKANRPGETWGDAAFIGIHQGYFGTETVATVNLDGTVRLLHRLAINQDPDTDASLRVGGLTKLDYLTLGGITRPDGYWFAAPSGYFGNPTSGTYTSFGDGGIKLSHPTTPYIDFHFNKSTADYTSRLIASEDGVLMIDSATADPALRIGNAYLRYDTANNALYVTGKNGAQVNLYATGGIAAYSAVGSVTQLANLQLTGQLRAKSVSVTGMVQASYILLDNFTLDTNNEYFEIRYNGLDYAENTLVLDVYGDIYDEGYLYVNGKTCLNETYIGSQASTYKITSIYADGSYVYITINGKKYKLANA